MWQNQQSNGYCVPRPLLTSPKLTTKHGPVRSTRPPSRTGGHIVPRWKDNSQSTILGSHYHDITLVVLQKNKRNSLYHAILTEKINNDSLHPTVAGREIIVYVCAPGTMS